MLLSQLLDMSVVQRLAEANYNANRMPIGIIDAFDGSILVQCGWQDICTRFHRAHPRSLARCQESDRTIMARLFDTARCEYQCRNGLRDIGIPIVAGGEHLATMFLGQFFYQGETPDRAFFVRQAREFEYDEQEYLAALDRVPVFSREVADNIVAYDTALSRFIADLAEGERQRHATAEERRRAMEQLAAEKEKLAVTLASIGDAVVATDEEGRVTVLNPVAEQLTGWSAREAVGRPLPEIFGIVDELTCAPAANPVDRVLRDGRVVGISNHTLLVARDGTERPIADSAAPIRESDGQISGVVLVFRDQTEERRSEQELRESETRYRLLFQNMLEGFAYCRLLFDEQGRPEDFVYLDVNSAFGPLTGLHDVVGKRVSEVIPGVRESHPELLEIYGRVTRTGRPERFEIYLRPLSIWLSVSVYSSHADHFVTVFDNITERKRAEEERDRLKSELHHAAKMEAIGQLAGGIAHDFNNLLTVILSGAEALRSGLGDGSRVDAGIADEIASAGGRARDLTRQLLAFARRQVIAPVPLDLNELVRRSEKLLRRVLGEDVELVAVLQPDLWSVRCDPGQLEQVVLNLVVNARAAMPRGGKLTIETANANVDERFAASRPWMRPGPYVRLTVRDSGHGMPPEVRERVFEPFFTTKPVGQGTGLGLATVYGIVKQSEGYILVESEPERGATFAVFLPRVTDAVVRPGPEPPPAVIATRGSETILVVEDDRLVREVTVRSLRAAGYAVLAASDGREALEIAARERQPLHLLVTDVVMPGEDGRAVANAVRRHHPEARVLYVSGYAEAAIVDRGVLEAGIEFLPKPFMPSTLLERVRALLDG
jgi:two-component system cell cycle sensor histidine kinase/response regulator CckA